MARIFPFKAIRPVHNKVHLVTTRSYISYSEQQLKVKLASNPFSFIHVLNPQGIQTAKLSLREKFKKVAQKFSSFKEKGFFLQEQSDCLYIYRQSFEQNSFTGVVCLVSVDEYKNSLIKKHERTLAKREQMFASYLKATQMHAEPVLMTYQQDTEITELIENSMQQQPVYDFVTHDQVLHQLWKIQATDSCDTYLKLFEKVKAFYIADGHHRSASSALLHEQLKQNKYDKFLAYLISDDQLNIKAFHRKLSLQNKSFESLKLLLEEHYNLEKKDAYSDHTALMMYHNSSWYALEEKENKEGFLPVERLSETILKPFLELKDLRNTEQITYIDSSQNIQQVCAKMSTTEVLFALRPISTQQLMQISDLQRTLPPKSTFIEPKLRSALLIYQYAS